MTLKELVYIGYICRYNTIQETFDNIIQDYDIFFNDNNFVEEYNNLMNELKSHNLMENNIIKNVTIKEIGEQFGYNFPDLDTFIDIDDTNFEINI